MMAVELYPLTTQFDDVICYGMHLKKSEPEMAEAIDIYKTLSDDTYYGPEEQATDPLQEEDQ